MRGVWREWSAWRAGGGAESGAAPDSAGETERLGDRGRLKTGRGEDGRLAGSTTLEGESLGLSESGRGGAPWVGKARASEEEVGFCCGDEGRPNLSYYYWNFRTAKCFTPPRLAVLMDTLHPPRLDC